MTIREIIERRLSCQHILTSTFSKPNEIIRWFGAMQSQDFSGAIWAISQRLNLLSKKEVETTFNEGTILRTHLLRPTWHFVTPEDIAWILKLSAPRVKKAMGTYNKTLGLNDTIFEDSETIITNELKHDKYLARNEIGMLLKKNGITWQGNGLAHIVMNAELNASICSGPIQNNKQTYALFSERVPNPITITKDAALKELTRRYFQSHGPAQISDYVWWSGLLTIDAKKGIELNTQLKHTTVEGKEYYFFDEPYQKNSKQVYLLSNYDEYTVAFRDRDVLTEHVDKTKLDFRQNSLFNNVVLIDGKIEGVWRRTIQSRRVTIETRLFKTLNVSEEESLSKALHEYADFLELELRRG